MDLREELEDEFGVENVSVTQYRSGELTELLVYLSSIGAFAGFWKVYRHLYERNRRINVKIKYKSGNHELEVDLKQQSKKDFEELQRKYPPDSNQRILIISD